MPGPSIWKTAMRRPLTPRISTSRSSPPRTSPKAPKKRSSVWSTLASRHSCYARGLPEESSAKVGRVEVSPSLLYSRVGVGCPPRLLRRRPPSFLARSAPRPKPVKRFLCGPVISFVFLRNQGLFLDCSGRLSSKEALLPRIGKYRTPIDDATLGQRLRSLRKKRGLSQAEVAEALAVHQSLVSEYERGTVRVPATVLAGLARTLRVPFQELIGSKATEENGSFRDRRFIRRLERIEKLPKRAKQALLKTIDTYLAGAEKR